MKIAFVLLYFALVLAALGGWIANIVKIFNMPWDTLTGELLIRLAGVPLFIIGAIAGWFA